MCQIAHISKNILRCTIINLDNNYTRWFLIEYLYFKRINARNIKEKRIPTNAWVELYFWSCYMCSELTRHIY